MLTSNEIRDLVEKDRFELMMRCPFYGRIICSAELVIVRDPQVRLACTDYRRIFISADTYPSLSEEKRLAVLAHEVLHIALRHAFRIGYRDKNRFEKAADIEVTFVLTESFPDPYGIKVKEEWRDLTAEQIYDLLPTREDKTKAKSEHCSPEDDKQGGGGSEDKQASNDDNGKTNDRADELDNKKDKSSDQDSKLKNKPSKSKSSKRKSGSQSTSDDNRSNADDGSINSDGSGDGEDGNGNGDGDGSGDGEDGNGNGDGDGSGDGEDGNGNGDGDGSGDGEDGNGNGDGDGSGDGNHDIFSEFRPQFDAETEMNCISLSSGTLMDMQRFGVGFGKGIGSSPGSFERLLEALDSPHVCWLILLRQFLRLCRGGGYSWIHPNRRFIAHGVYLPGRQCKSFTGIVALDTSPSTFADLPRFVAELMGLLKSFGEFDITVLECAKSIEQVWNISSNEPILNVSKHAFKAGFGTDFTPVFDYIHEHNLTPNILIYFTDGDGPCPETRPPYPVLWMLTKGGKAPVPWGQIVYYEEN